MQNSQLSIIQSVRFLEMINAHIFTNAKTD